MTKLDNNIKLRQRPVLTHLMNEITSNDYQLGYFQDIYDLPYKYPDKAYELEAKEWIALLEHAWKFVYRAAIEDNHLCESERMDLNNIHKLRNFYSAQLKSGRKLHLHHNFFKKTHKATDLGYENDMNEALVLQKKYNPKPEESVNNPNSPYYVPKPWEVSKMTLKPYMTN